MTTIYYSKKTKGFYPSDIFTNENMPDDVLEISFEDYKTLIEGQMSDKIINFETTPPSLMNISLTEDEIEQLYTNSLQSFMDSKAKEKRYDNIKSAALRAALPDSPFHSEGVAAGTWMDNCWHLSYQILAEVKAGTRPMPTVEELIALMPELVW